MKKSIVTCVPKMSHQINFLPLAFTGCIWSQRLGDSLYFDLFVRQLFALMVALLQAVHAKCAL